MVPQGFNSITIIAEIIRMTLFVIISCVRALHFKISFKYFQACAIVYVLYRF